MTIDAERLEEAAKWARGFIRDSQNSGCSTQLGRLADAAEALLPTLPRYKEVPVELWVRFDGARVQGFASDRTEVDENIAKFGGYAVRLTGTAKVRA